MSDDPKRLLRAARRSSINAQEQMRPGMADFMLCVFGAMAAALVTGAYYHSISGRLLAVVIMLGGAYTIAKSLRAREGLGVPLSRSTVIVPAAVFVASLIADVALSGSARDASVFVILGAGAAAQAAVLRNAWFALVSAGLAAVALLGVFVVPHSSSTESLALGAVFGVVVGVAARRRAVASSSSDSLKRRP